MLRHSGGPSHCRLKACLPPPACRRQDLEGPPQKGAPGPHRVSPVGTEGRLARGRGREGGCALDLHPRPVATTPWEGGLRHHSDLRGDPRLRVLTGAFLPGHRMFS